MSLKLVQLGLSGAAMFGPHGKCCSRPKSLHKKAVLVERGSFRPATVVNLDMLESPAPTSSPTRGPGKTGPALGADHAQPAGRRGPRWTDATSWLAPTCWPRGVTG